jgi:hypothetical protein
MSAAELLAKSSRCLADSNAAREAGKVAKAEKLIDKSQYWLDRYNRAVGND